MRVPIPLVMVLSLAVVGGVWWYGTHQMDFLTPPSAARLAEVKARVEASIPPLDHPGDAVSAPPPEKDPPAPPPAEVVKPALELGDLNAPPVLAEYRNLAPKGAAHLVDLAVLLETEGEYQRGLLAWERVLDSVKPDAAQTAAALTSIKRLRPTLPDWNGDPAKSIAITLHAGTGSKHAKLLTPALEEVARNMEHASAGILKVTAIVTSAREHSGSAAHAPVALWLAGPAKKSRSTEVMSFTIGTPESLHEEIQKTVFQIVRGAVGHGDAHTPPPELAAGETPLDGLSSHVTRLHWQELGNTLNAPPEKTR